MQNLTDRIVAYESGKLDQDQTIQLFQELYDSGMVWNLQGHYGRLAFQLLEAGLIRGWQQWGGVPALPAPTPLMLVPGGCLPVGGVLGTFMTRG